MIGKGKYFDIISRTVEDANNPEIPISVMMQKFYDREEKLKKILMKKKDK